MMHIDAETLAAWADDDTRPRDAEAAHHLAACATCQAELDELRAVVAAFRTPEFWQQVRTEAARDQGADALKAFERTYRREVEDGTQLLAALTAAELRTQLASGTFQPTLGLVDALIRASEQARVDTPPRALEYAELAVAMATALPPGYRTTVEHGRGLAEKELANVLRVLGRFAEAHAALDRATAHFTPLPATHFDLVGVAFIRATLWAATERYDDALALTRDCATQFTEYGEITRGAAATMLEAYIHTLRGQPALSRPLLEGLIAPLEAAGDAETLATVWANLGTCLVELHEWSAATAALARAAAAFRAAGHWLGETRARWRLGSVQLGQGQVDAGLAALDTARRAFLARGLPIETAIVSLELVDALLAHGRVAEARDRCLHLADDCLRLAMPSNALAAVAYLQECEAAAGLSLAGVRHVRTFFDRYQHDPAFVFQPLRP